MHVVTASFIWELNEKFVGIILSGTWKTTWTHKSFCQELIVLPGACVWGLDTYFILSPINHFDVIFGEISYQAIFCFQILYPAILSTMLIGLLNTGSLVFNALLPGTSKAFTLSVFLLGAHLHVLLPGTPICMHKYFANVYVGFDSGGVEISVISWI